MFASTEAQYYHAALAQIGFEHYAIKTAMTTNPINWVENAFVLVAGYTVALVRAVTDKSRGAVDVQFDQKVTIYTNLENTKSIECSGAISSAEDISKRDSLTRAVHLWNCDGGNSRLFYGYITLKHEP